MQPPEGTVIGRSLPLHSLCACAEVFSFYNGEKMPEPRGKNELPIESVLGFPAFLEIHPDTQYINGKDVLYLVQQDLVGLLK